MATTSNTRTGSSSSGDSDSRRTQSRGATEGGSGQRVSGAGASGTGYGTTPSSGSTAGTAGMGDTGNGHTSRGLVDGLQQRVQEQVRSSADQQKRRAADGIGGIAQVFQHAGNEVRDENEMLAQYIDMAGDRLRRFADAVRDRGVEEMVDDVQRFARRRPAVFIGGAFLVGLGLARFLKSSSERNGADDRGYAERTTRGEELAPIYPALSEYGASLPSDAGGF